MSAPDRAVADRVDELCRCRDLIAAVPDTGGWVDASVVRGLLRDRIEQLNWGDEDATLDG